MVAAFVSSVFEVYECAEVAGSVSALPKMATVLHIVLRTAISA